MECGSYLQRQRVVMLQEPHELQSVLLVQLPQFLSPLIRRSGPLVAEKYETLPHLEQHPG